MRWALVFAAAFSTLPSSDAGVFLCQVRVSRVLFHALPLICDRLWSSGVPAGESGAGLEAVFCTLAVGALSSIA